ncbi:MAG: hypothetical protein ACLFRG_13925 [Desulfococcaceae bacterium]
MKGNFPESAGICSLLIFGSEIILLMSMGIILAISVTQNIKLPDLYEKLNIIDIIIDFVTGAKFDESEFCLLTKTLAGKAFFRLEGEGGRRFFRRKKFEKNLPWPVGSKVHDTEMAGGEERAGKLDGALHFRFQMNHHACVAMSGPDVPKKFW